VEREVAIFESLRDGCRAAALVCQFRDYAPVQVAYRTDDPILLARALEASPLRADVNLSGFEDELHRLGGRPALVHAVSVCCASLVNGASTLASHLAAAGGWAGERTTARIMRGRART
jgi:hypothetical protein